MQKRLCITRSSKQLAAIYTSSAALYTAVGFLAAVVFVLIYGFRVLNPVYTDWLMKGGDLTQHYLGWMAYRNGPWTFPIGMTNTLAYPTETSLIFTDSIPCFAVFFKLIAFMLPENFQYFGLWGLMCFVLQGVFAAKIFRGYTQEPLAVILASLLLLFVPAMIFRMYVHTSLGGHWLLLMGMDQFLDKKKKNQHLMIGLMAVLAASTHIYFVLLCGMILAAICLRELLEKRVLRGVLLLVIYLGATSLTVAFLGGFAEHAAQDNGGLGYFSTNLNTFFNSLGWSAFLPQLPLYTDGQGEGFAYLGAGCLLLMVLATCLFLFQKGKARALKNNRNDLIGLSVLFSLALFLSLSHIASFGGRRLYEIPIGGFVAELWSTFRATGRIVWVCVYVLVLLAGIVVLKKAGKRLGLILLCVCLSLQVYDLHGVLKDKNEEFTTEACYNSIWQDDAFWDAVAENATIRHIVYMCPMEQEPLFSIAQWALSHGKTVSNFYFARVVVDAAAAQMVRDDPTEADLLLYATTDLLIDPNSALYYYEVGDYIAAYKAPVDGFTPMDIAEHASVRWTFGDGFGLSAENAQDSADGRILYPGGYSFGPYLGAEKGIYQICLEGKLPEGTEIAIRTKNGKEEQQPDKIEQRENGMVITVTLKQCTKDLEVFVKNNTEETVLLKAMQIRPIEQ